MEKLIAVGVSLAVFVTWEATRPFFSFQRGHRLRAGYNGLVGATNALLTNLVFSGVMAWVLSQVASRLACRAWSLFPSGPDLFLP